MHASVAASRASPSGHPSPAATHEGPVHAVAPAPPVEAPKPVAAPTDGTSKKTSAQDDKAAKSAAVDALVAGEAKSGACDEGHKAALEKLLADAESTMMKNNGLQLVGKRVIPLG